MTIKKKTLADVENVLDFSLGVIALARDGDKQELENGAFDYTRMVIEAAEKDLRIIKMYETTLIAINAAEKLLQRNNFLEAYKILQGLSCDLMQKSGTAEEMRNLFDKLKSP